MFEIYKLYRPTEGYPCFVLNNLDVFVNRRGYSTTIKEVIRTEENAQIFLVLEELICYYTAGNIHWYKILMNTNLYSIFIFERDLEDFHLFFEEVKTE